MTSSGTRSRSRASAVDEFTEEVALGIRHDRREEPEGDAAKETFNLLNRIKWN